LLTHNGTTRKEMPRSKKSITGFVFLGGQYSVKSWKGLLVSLCGLLYRNHKTEFHKALSLHGTKRIYFGEDPGQMRLPEQVGDSNFFVETHWGANSITKICYKLLSLFGYPASVLQIKD